MNAAFLAINPPVTSPGIRVSGYFYVVDFGADVQPRYHHVGKNAACNCSLGEKCPAVKQVQKYLDAGGERAAKPRPGFYPSHPHRCPICGAEVVVDRKLSSMRRGIGWRCTKGGAGHYWQRQTHFLQAAFQRKYANLQN